MVDCSTATVKVVVPLLLLSAEEILFPLGLIIGAIELSALVRSIILRPSNSCLRFSSTFPTMYEKLGLVIKSKDSSFLLRSSRWS